MDWETSELTHLGCATSSAWSKVSLGVPLSRSLLLAHCSLLSEAFTCADTRQGPTWQPWCCPQTGQNSKWCQISKVVLPCPRTGSGGELVSTPGTRLRGCGAPADYEVPRAVGATQDAAPHLPVPLPPGAVLVSGVYDLEPILHTYVNDVLNMSR